MSTNEAVFFNEGVLSAQNESGDSIPLAGVQDLTITPAYEHAQLYTVDSTFRAEVKRYEHNVNVDVGFAKFSFNAIQEWLGGEGATATASQDDNDPALFQIEQVADTADGTAERTVAVADVVFPEFPVIDGSRGEFETYDLSGSGRKITDLSDTSGAT